MFIVVFFSAMLFTYRSQFNVNERKRSSFYYNCDSIARRLQRYICLRIHDGCVRFSWIFLWLNAFLAKLYCIFKVNSIKWSEDGRYIVSGSDDRYLIVADPFDPVDTVKAKVQSGHGGNVFSVRFMPGTSNNIVISSASCGTVVVTVLDRPDTYGKNIFYCHYGSTYEVFYRLFSFLDAVMS